MFLTIPACNDIQSGFQLLCESRFTLTFPREHLKTEINTWDSGTQTCFNSCKID